VLPKSERLQEVKAHKEMLLLPAEHSAPGSLEECRWVIAMTMYCQLQRLMLDLGVDITTPGLAGERVIDCSYVLSVNAGVQISGSTYPLLVVGRTRCSQLEIGSQKQGWSFLLLLTHHWLLQGLGVRT